MFYRSRYLEQIVHPILIRTYQDTVWFDMSFFYQSSRTGQTTITIIDGANHRLRLILKIRSKVKVSQWWCPCTLQRYVKCVTRNYVMTVLKHSLAQLWMYSNCTEHHTGFFWTTPDHLRDNTINRFITSDVYQNFKKHGWHWVPVTVTGEKQTSSWDRAMYRYSYIYSMWFFYSWVLHE